MLSHSVVSNTLCLHGLCPPSWSVLGIFQARVAEWADISYSRGSSQSREICLVVFNLPPFFNSLMIKILTSSTELTSGPHKHNIYIRAPTQKEQYSCNRKIPCSQRFISYMNPTVLLSFLHNYTCSDFKAKGNIKA